MGYNVCLTKHNYYNKLLNTYINNEYNQKQPLQELIPQRQFLFPRSAPEVDPGIFNQRRSFEQPFQGCSFLVCKPLVF